MKSGFRCFLLLFLVIPILIHATQEEVTFVTIEIKPIGISENQDVLCETLYSDNLTGGTYISDSIKGWLILKQDGSWIEYGQDEKDAIDKKRSSFSADGMNGYFKNEQFTFKDLGINGTYALQKTLGGQLSILDTSSTITSFFHCGNIYLIQNRVDYYESAEPDYLPSARFIVTRDNIYGRKPYSNENITGVVFLNTQMPADSGSAESGWFPVYTRTEHIFPYCDPEKLEYSFIYPLGFSPDGVFALFREYYDRSDNRFLEFQLLDLICKKVS